MEKIVVICGMCDFEENLCLSAFSSSSFFFFCVVAAPEFVEIFVSRLFRVFLKNFAKKKERKEQESHLLL